MISHLLLLGPCLLHHQLMILWWSCLTLFWENKSQHEGTPPSSHRQPAAFCHSLPLSSQWRKWPSSHPRPALAPSSYSLKDLTLKWPLLFALLLISSSGFFPIAHRQCISLWTWPFLPPPPPIAHQPNVGWDWLSPSASRWKQFRECYSRTHSYWFGEWQEPRR